MTKKYLLPLCALLAAVPASAAQKDVAEREARIPLLSYGTVRDFRPIDNDTVFFRAGRRWYRAETVGYCQGLRFAHRIGVNSRGMNSLDRFSDLIVEGRRCPIASLVESPAPDPSLRRR